MKQEIDRRMKKIRIKFIHTVPQVKRSLRARGVRGIVAVGVSKVGNLIQYFALEQRRRRRDRHAFDRQHHVRTAAVIQLADLDVWDRAEHSIEHQPTPPHAFRKILSGLGIAYEDFFFVDLGSGLGRALLLASEFPFKKIIGVEYSSDLHRIAERNLRSFKSAAQRCRDIELVCMDATNYSMPEENTVIYLYNPFQGPKMQQVLDNVGRSLESHPREIVLVYYNAYHDLSEMARFLAQSDHGQEDNNPFVIYRARATQDYASVVQCARYGCCISNTGS